MATPQTILKQYFGYDTFRRGQEELIDALLAGRDAFGVMPTGAGKSLCYQIPALLLEGVTLVVSPLISLMKDQVSSLVQAGVPAAFLNSSLTARQYRLALTRACAGAYRIIYVAPERLLTPDFQQAVRQIPIAMVCIDEAHCVSQWGQDFRPGYLDIPRFIGTLGYRPVLGAFTATATAQVREDVVRLLALRDPLVVTTGFDRENLLFSVERPTDKYGALLAFLQENREAGGIVYCATRKAVEEVCDRLGGDGFSATRYHAGLDENERRRNQDDFIYDRAAVMVATNAFGMGIDKSNVKFVVHYNMPKDMESYYQEAGRAGRDGEPAQCLLLYSGQDVITNQFLISHAGENDALDEETRALLQQRDRDRLKAMTYYSTTNDCLRGYILRYFGEQAPSYCGNCGNCLNHFEEADITQDAHKILLCVQHTGERYGVRLIALILHGGEQAARDPRIERGGFARLPVYGTLEALTMHAIQEEIRFLEREGYLASSGGEYPVLSLGERADEVFTQETRILMKRAQPVEKRVAPRKKKAVQEVVHPELFEALRQLRRRLAAVQGVPPYVVFTDAALRGMCAQRPTSREELLEVSGVGQVKAEKYGDRFLEEIKKFIT